MATRREAGASPELYPSHLPLPFVLALSPSPSPSHLDPRTHPFPKQVSESPEYMDLVSLRGPAVPAASRARPPPPPLPPPTEEAGAPAISKATSKAMSEADAAALDEWDELGKVNMFPSGKKHDTRSLFKLGLFRQR